MVVGRVNPAYFGCSKIEDLPSDILTANSGNTDFVSFSGHHQLKSGEWLVKLFSHQKMTDVILNKIFLDRSWIHVKVWKSYPYLLSNQTFPPIELDENFFYVNSFEPLISVRYLPLL